MTSVADIVTELHCMPEKAVTLPAGSEPHCMGPQGLFYLRAASLIGYGAESDAKRYLAQPDANQAEQVAA